MDIQNQSSLGGRPLCMLNINACFSFLRLFLVGSLLVVSGGAVPENAAIGCAYFHTSRWYCTSSSRFTCPPFYDCTKQVRTVVVAEGLTRVFTDISGYQAAGKHVQTERQDHIHFGGVFHGEL